MAGKIEEIQARDFASKVLQADKVVVDFYSTECPPCEALAPKYQALSELYGDHIKFVKIFRQDNRSLAESLGVKSSPTVLFYDQGQLRQERLMGGIRRSELMEKLDALIPPEQAASIRKGIPGVESACDVLILGGGPAGLAAAIYAAQAKLDTLLVDTALPGGQVTTTHQVSNYPGFIEPQPGYMLAHYMSEQAKAAGVRFHSAVEMSSVDLQNKRVVVDGVETITAKSLIIATGAVPRPLGIPGEREFKGQGISYCATCDAKYFQDQEVVVIGGGNSAIEESLFISRFASKITVVHQFAELQANKAAQEKAVANQKMHFRFQHEPRAFIKRGDTMEVRIENLNTGEMENLSCAGAFVFVGMKPNLELFDGALVRDRWGYIQVDQEMRTNLAGVFAVGDVRAKAFRQITTAVADGTIAAIAAARDLE